MRQPAGAGQALPRVAGRAVVSRREGGPPREAMERAIEGLAAMAIHEGETLRTAIRVGHADGAA